MNNYKETIRSLVDKFISRINEDKQMEVTFKHYFGAQNENNKIQLLQYLDPYFLSFSDNDLNIVCWVLGYIAKTKNNNENFKNGENSFLIEYAKIVKTRKKAEKEKATNKVNELLRKRDIKAMLSFLRTNILYELESEFNYVDFMLDMLWFNKNKTNSTNSKWGKQFYFELNKAEIKE